MFFNFSGHTLGICVDSVGFSLGGGGWKVSERRNGVSKILGRDVWLFGVKNIFECRLSRVSNSLSHFLAIRSWRWRKQDFSDFKYGYHEVGLHVSSFVVVEFIIIRVNPRFLFSQKMSTEMSARNVEETKKELASKLNSTKIFIFKIGKSSSTLVYRSPWLIWSAAGSPNVPTLILTFSRVYVNHCFGEQFKFHVS